jgi:methanogenic corrinoid protein MtbC1
MTDPGSSIAAVERDTGLSKDTLRIWERRYGFPQPLRDALGERAYPREQVEKLRLLKRLVDAGHRPGKLVGLELRQLQALGEAAVPAGERTALPAPVQDLLAAHDAAGLRRVLQQGLLARGLARFVIEEVAPLNTAIGEAWMRGEISVAQEHLYTEALQVVLRQAIGAMPLPAEGAPVVLLATLPEESHGLGLLMAEALLGLHGWRCLSLGTNVPMEDLVTAARLVDADAVGLSFSGSFRPSHVAESLAVLRQRLPSHVRLWAGGACLALQRRLPAGVEAVPDISLVSGLVQRRGHAPDMPPP